MEYYCPICHNYHDSSACYPRQDYPQMLPSTQDPNFELTWRLDKIISLLETISKEVLTK